MPAHRFALWWFLLMLGDVVFYVVLTPIWLGLRAAAWIAELRSARAPLAARRPRRAQATPAVKAWRDPSPSQTP